MNTAHAIDMRNRPTGDLSLKLLVILALLSPVGMVMLTHGASWALGPETVLLSREHNSFHTVRLPCMRRCDQRATN